VASERKLLCCGQGTPKQRPSAPLLMCITGACLLHGHSFLGGQQVNLHGLGKKGHPAAFACLNRCEECCKRPAEIGRPSASLADPCTDRRHSGLSLRS